MPFLFILIICTASAKYGLSFPRADFTMESLSRVRHCGFCTLKTQSQYGLKLKQEPLAWPHLFIAYQRATVGVLVGNE